MAQAAWEKANLTTAAQRSAARDGGRWKFLVGGVLILVAVGYMIISSTISGASFFITIDELLANPEYLGQDVRISGAVLGDTIEYDSENLTIRFTISHIPQNFDNLAVALDESVSNPNLSRIEVYIENEVKPDLLQHAAQAIVSGTLGADGVFYATELLLKCPTRLEENSVPGGVQPHMLDSEA